MIKDKSLLKWKLTKQQNEKEWVRAGGDMNRWMCFCQSFVLVSDPQRGTFTSMVIRSVSVWVSVSIRAVQKEGGSSRVSGCWSRIEFWQVAPCKGPAGSVEDVLHGREHLSWYLAASINFMVVCADFTSTGNALGLTLENGTAMNINKEVNSYKDMTAR